MKEGRSAPRRSAPNGEARTVPHSVIIHGHFYQPPREDPWTGEIRAQPSAAPFHDWNARIEAECYRAVAAARILGPEGRIREILNCLELISFNFGPTLLNWMDGEAPSTYQAILEADARSVKRLGHGNAMAQAYHHTILPLASRREKATEVRWGMEDFRRRFRRDPAGMWLPETALDDETLDVLAQEGIAFTVVAPHQVDPLPSNGMPGLYRTENGRSIVLFPYDGPVSHGVAFGALLKNAEGLAHLLSLKTTEGGSAEEWSPRTTGDPEHQVAMPGQVPPRPESSPRRLVSIATDGETYGHHHRFGEMALAAALLRLRANPDVRVENYASFLDHSPPAEEVTLVEPSSWSCSHGVDRWRTDCGCKMDPSRPTQQGWRGPLRSAMEGIADEIHERFTGEGTALLGDPWEARNAYGRVVSGSESLEDFLTGWMDGEPSDNDSSRAACLLELERNALRLFTSCAWFFDDLAGIEPRQILRYAARALELLGDRGEKARADFLARMGEAQTNETPPRDGATLFLDEEESRSLIERWVPADDPTKGPASTASIETLSGLALEQAVNQLGKTVAGSRSDPNDPGKNSRLNEVAGDIERLAYLHIRMAIPIPFNAQTSFHRIWEAIPDEIRSRLKPLRKPLGFVP